MLFLFLFLFLFLAPFHVMGILFILAFLLMGKIIFMLYIHFFGSGGHAKLSPAIPALGSEFHWVRSAVGIELRPPLKWSVSNHFIIDLNIPM
jgi:hypothetical protein